MANLASSCLRPRQVCTSKCALSSSFKARCLLDTSDRCQPMSTRNQCRWYTVHSVAPVGHLLQHYSANLVPRLHHHVANCCPNLCSCCTSCILSVVEFASCARTNQLVCASVHLRAAASFFRQADWWFVLAEQHIESPIHVWPCSKTPKTSGLLTEHKYMRIYLT